MDLDVMKIVPFCLVEIGELSICIILHTFVVYM